MSEHTTTPWIEQAVTELAALRAENARLRAACELAVKSLRDAMESIQSRREKFYIETDITQLRAALAGKEPQ